MQTQPLSVPGPHVRPNIIPHIASTASPVSQRQQYIQQKVIAGKRTFTFLPPPCDPVSTTLAASVSEHLARALQSLGTGKSLSLKDIEVTQNPRLVAQRMSQLVISKLWPSMYFAHLQLSSKAVAGSRPMSSFLCSARLARLKKR